MVTFIMVNWPVSRQMQVLSVAAGSCSMSNKLNTVIFIRK